jgi:hypothetical protein
LSGPWSDDEPGADAPARHEYALLHSVSADTVEQSFACRAGAGVRVRLRLWAEVLISGLGVVGGA